MSFRSPERSEAITLLRRLGELCNYAASLDVKMTPEQMIRLRDLVPTLENQIIDILGDSYEPKSPNLPWRKKPSDAKDNEGESGDLQTPKKSLNACPVCFLEEE